MKKVALKLFFTIFTVFFNKTVNSMKEIISDGNNVEHINIEENKQDN